MKGVVIALIAMIAMVQFMAEPGQALDCVKVNSHLVPCIPYLTGGGNPTSTCCDGVKAVKAMATNTADKRAACNCVKAAASAYPDLKDDMAKALPSKCDVQFDIPISRSIDCNTIG